MICWAAAPSAAVALESLHPADSRLVVPVFRVDVALIPPFFVTEWMKTQLRLAQLYRKVGREQEAREIEAELLKLLAYADADHPFLRQLQRSQEVALAQPPNFSPDSAAPALVGTP